MLVVLLVGAVLQLALALHVRNTMIASAAEGARVAARADTTLVQGERRAEEMLRAALGDFPVEVSSSTAVVNGAEVVVIGVSAPVPVLGLWGAGTMTVDARAYREEHRG